MTISRNGGPEPRLNVTPLVDVALVLLIVFMLGAVTQSGYFVQSAVRSTALQPVRPAPRVVLEEGGAVRLDGVVVERADFEEALRRRLAERGDRSVFFAAGDGLSFELVADLLDSCRAAGAEPIVRLPASG